MSRSLQNAIDGGDVLTITCQGCGRATDKNLDDLATRLGPSHDAGEMWLQRYRFVCSLCGSDKVKMAWSNPRNRVPLTAYAKMKGS